MFHTLAAPASHALEVKHSRFLAHAAPVAHAADALAFVAAASLADATHNCWAWRCGSEYRSNDDGEPAGTAGRPILAAIDGQGCDRVAVVVTRWFGGIKLGAGGLARAYGGAAAQCLRLAQRVPLVAMQRLHLACPFDELGAVYAQLAAHAADKLGEAFDELGARLSIEVSVERVDGLKIHLRDATRDKVRWLNATS